LSPRPSLSTPGSVQVRRVIVRRHRQEFLRVVDDLNFVESKSRLTHKRLSMLLCILGRGAGENKSHGDEPLRGQKK